jgi:hypothetical protein
LEGRATAELSKRLVGTTVGDTNHVFHRTNSLPEDLAMWQIDLRTDRGLLRFVPAP